MSDDDYSAQLLAVEAGLAKDPENEELMSLRADLLELIELSGSLAEDTPQERDRTEDQTKKQQPQPTTSSQPSSSNNNDDDANSKNNMKKNAMMKKKKKKPPKRFDEPDTSSWQSFTRQRGLKGVSKRSIFESPQSVTGKVGVGTNGIADAPLTKGASSAPKRRY